MPRKKRQPGGVYLRGRTYWMHYRVDGERYQESTGKTDLRDARAVLAETRRKIRAGAWVPPKTRRGQRELTVAVYAEGWLERREAAGVVNFRDEKRWIQQWLLPDFGALPLRDVTREHIRDLVAKMQATPSPTTKRPYAARTVLHVYQTVRLVFADAEAEGLILKTPCTLRQRRGELPAKRDVNPQWRAAAVYTREELEALISDERVPVDRRVYYALGGLAGLRSKEIQGRRWRDLDTDAAPLGYLTVHSQAEGAAEKAQTKTGDIKIVPVHPALAAILAEWRIEGFPLRYGHAPRPDDFIIPSRMDPRRARTKKMLERMKGDLRRLNLRTEGRGRHALRATFLTLLESSGANMAIAARATHRTPMHHGALAGYLRGGWSELCAEVAKLRIERRKGVVVPLRQAVGSYKNSYNPSGGEGDGKKTPAILGGSRAHEHRGDWIRTSDPHTPSMVR